jgi:hypothetical protein
MNFGVFSILPASSVSSAALVPLFDDERNFLAISKGRRLFIYRLPSMDVAKQVIHEFFARIVTLIPISHPYYMQSNLLIVFDNFRAVVLGHDGLTKSQLSFPPSLDARMPNPLRFAVHPECVAMQLTSSSIDIFPISSQSLLESNFPMQVSCKRIRDITFIGPVSKVVRLAALTEEFNTAPCVHLFDIDLQNMRYEEDARKKVFLPCDSYLMRSLSPESASIAIVFAAQ